MRFTEFARFVIAVALAHRATSALADEPSRELVLQTPPAMAVNSVTVSPDGSLVATAAADGIHIYQAQTGQLLRVFGGTTDRYVAFSPDGHQITAAGFHMDKLVPVFDVQTGRRLHALPGHTEWEADAAAISPDGKLLASTGVDKQILVWELPSGRLRTQLAHQPNRSATLAFSPDSSILATGGGDQKIDLWDTKSGHLLRSLTRHNYWVSSLAFSPDGKSIVSGSCDWGFHRGHDWPRPAGRSTEVCEWKLWDVDSGKCLHTATDSGPMLAVAYAPDGKSIAIAVGKTLRIHDLAQPYSSKVLVTHDGTITSVAFTPDGASVVTSSHDQTIKRTSLSTGKLQWQAPGSFEQVNSVAISDGASLVVTGSSDHRFMRGHIKASAPEIGPGAIRIWDFNTGRLQHTLGDPANQVLAVAISAHAKQIFSGGATNQNSGLVQAWDAVTGAQQWSAADHKVEVLAVAISPNGAFLASGDADGTVKLRDAKTGNVSQTLSGPRRGATSLAFSADGKALYCGEGFGGTQVWDVSSGRQLHYLPPANTRADGYHVDRLLNSIGCTRDGRLLATCASSVNDEFTDAVRFWNPQTGLLVRSFAAENIHGRPMALSPDGTIIATGGKSVQLWDVQSGAPLRQLNGILKRTQSIVFSADGKAVVAGGSYGTTNIWDVRTGQLQFTLFAFLTTGDAPTVNDRQDNWLAYHPDGTFIGSPGIDRYLAWRHADDLETAQQKKPE